MASVIGTPKADKITVNASEVIVATGKKSKPYAISKKGKNTINGAAGKDTITVSGGKSNYIYGGKGNDTFVISKKSTGTALVKDFSNKEIVQIAGGAVKNIKVSGKDIIIYGGKNGKASLTLKNAKGKTFTVKGSSNSYTVTKGVVGVTLKKDFKGTFNAPAFVTTIDARKVTNDIKVNGNAKANTIYAGKNGGTYNGGDGNDTIKVTGGDAQTIYGGKGIDTITIAGHDSYHLKYVDGGDGADIISIKDAYYGDGGTYLGDSRYYGVAGGKGTDNITVTNNNWLTVKGGEDNDIITVNSGLQNKIYGDAGNDIITVKGGSGHTIDGGTGADSITIERGKETVINGNDGNDTIIVKSDADVKKIDGGSGNDVIKSYGKVTEIYGGAGNDQIYFYEGSISGNTSCRYIDGQEGNDTITVAAGTHYVADSTGNNTFNITGGSNHRIEGGDGQDTIKLNSGSGHKVSGGAGVDTIYVNAGGGHEIESGAGADNIIVDMSKDLRSFTIKSVAGDTADNLTINNAEFDDFTFKNDGVYMIMSFNDCDIKVEGWDSNNPFSTGVIKFGSTPIPYDQISDAAKGL